MTEKTCTKCGETKPAESFGKKAASKDGLSPHCRACKKATRQRRGPVEPVTPPQGYWYAVERDGDVTIVQRCGSGQQVMVWFADGSWSCSECGAGGTSRHASPTCVHVATATRSMPLETALALGQRAMGPRAVESRPGVSAKAVLEAEAAILKAGAEKRAEWARRHDERHQPVVGEVVVRQQTKEDRERLRLARARKSRAFEQPVHPGRFA